MRKRTMVIAAVAVLAVGGGVAYAAWSSTGSGSGSVSSKADLASTITPLGGTGLYPGGSVDFTVEINNPNEYPVRVTGISTGSSDEVNGCAAGTVTSAAFAGSADVITPGQKVTYTLHATMDDDASDACKSQTFTLPLTATLTSVA